MVCFYKIEGVFSNFDNKTEDNYLKPRQSLREHPGIKENKDSIFNIEKVEKHNV